MDKVNQNVARPIVRCPILSPGKSSILYAIILCMCIYIYILYTTNSEFLTSRGRSIRNPLCSHNLLMMCYASRYVCIGVLNNLPQLFTMPLHIHLVHLEKSGVGRYASVSRISQIDICLLMINLDCQRLTFDSVTAQSYSINKAEFILLLNFPSKPDSYPKYPKQSEIIVRRKKILCSYRIQGIHTRLGSSWTWPFHTETMST